jgi:hypothetical protein
MIAETMMAFDLMLRVRETHPIYCYCARSL